MADDDIKVRLRGRYAMLINGLIDVEELDDEEVARGQLRAVDGTFRGRPPKLIPAELVQAMRREWLARAEGRLREALMEHGIGTLIELAKDDLVDPSVRARCAEKIIERTMGKVPDRIQVAAEDPVEALFKSILSDPDGLAPAPKEHSADVRQALADLL